MSHSKHYLIVLAGILVVGAGVYLRNKRIELEEARQAVLREGFDATDVLYTLDSHKIEPVEYHDKILFRYPYSESVVGQPTKLYGVSHATFAGSTAVFRSLSKSSLQSFDATKNQGVVVTDVETLSLHVEDDDGKMYTGNASIRSRRITEADVLGHSKVLLNRIRLNQVSFQDNSVSVPLVFPEDPVAIGEQWSYSMDVSDVAEEGDTAELTAKLTEVVKFDGKLAARIEAEVKTWGSESGPWEMTGKRNATASSTVIPMSESRTYFFAIPEMNLLWMKNVAKVGGETRAVMRAQGHE